MAVGSVEKDVGGWSACPLILTLIQGNTTANASLITYHQWCAYPSKRALVLIRLTSFPNMFLNLPRDVICSIARFKLHILRFETATWDQSNSPTCDLCDAC